MMGKISISLVVVMILFSMCRKKMGGHDAFPEIEPHKYELIGVHEKINQAFGGYYVGLPPQYHDNTDSLPLFLFLHGLGQMGNGQDHLPYLLYDGIGKLLKDNRVPTTIRSGKENFSFIIVSPQFSVQPSVNEVVEMLDYICKAYRVNKRRVYLSGLSLGARVATLVAAEFPYRFAAIVPIAGVAITPGMQDRCKAIGKAMLPVWEFHNSDDPLADVNDAKRFINFLLAIEQETEVKMTIFDAFGHDAWTRALDSSYKEDKKNIYEWMLQFSR